MGSYDVEPDAVDPGATANGDPESQVTADWPPVSRVTMERAPSSRRSPPVFAPETARGDQADSGAQTNRALTVS